MQPVLQQLWPLHAAVRRGKISWCNIMPLIYARISFNNQNQFLHQGNIYPFKLITIYIFLEKSVKANFTAQVKFEGAFCFGYQI